MAFEKESKIVSGKIKLIIGTHTHACVKVLEMDDNRHVDTGYLWD